MKKLFFLLIAACFCGNAQAAIITTLDFETQGDGYTTTVAEFSDGNGDFFTQTDGSNIGGFVDYGTNQQGTAFFAAMDIDGEGAAPTQSILWSDLDISGFTDLSIDFLLAEDDDGTNEDWDVGDHFRVFASLDNGAEFQIFGVENDGSTFNSAPLVDTNLDGTGDGTEIISDFVNFNALIAGVGAELDLRFEFNLNSGDEDLAIDNIRLNGSSSAVPEPSALAVLGLVGLGCFRRRRSS